MSAVGRRGTVHVRDARAWRIAVGARRRVLAGTFAALSVLLAVTALRPPQSGSGEPVVVAAVDLDGGVVLHPNNLRVVALPADVVPAGAVTGPATAVGRILAAPVRRGEPITDVRFLGPNLITDGLAKAGMVGAPVRISDADSVQFLRVGDRVNVLAAFNDAATTVQHRDGPASTDDAETARAMAEVRPADAARAVVVAPDVLVLAVPRPADKGEEGQGDGAEGALVIVAATPRVATVLAGAAVQAKLSVTVLGRARLP